MLAEASSQDSWLCNDKKIAMSEKTLSDETYHSGLGPSALSTL